MPFTIGGFYEDIDAAGGYVNLAAIPDPHLTIVGDDLEVPDLDRLVWVAFGIGSGGLGEGRLQSPTLERLGRIYVTPSNGGNDGDVQPDSPHAVYDLRQNPRRLTATEQLNALIHSNTSAVAIQWAICGFSNGPIAPLSGQEMFTLRATNTTTLTVGGWTNGSLTLAENLEVGTYQIVGCRFQSAGLIAARFVLRRAAHRPGALAVDDVNDLEHSMFRMGGLGVWGEFHTSQIPTVDWLSMSADSSQVAHIDLVKVG
jgi:hypothetical protein